MSSGNIKITTDQKDWDDFFAPEPDSEDAFAPVDLYAARVRVACELSNRQIDASDQRLVEAKAKEIGAKAEFKFDRQVWPQDPGYCDPSGTAMDARNTRG